jgi:transcriptional regulator with XRE-family HTH domain
MGSTPGSASGNQPLDEVFAVNVRRARENKRMSVAALARRTGYMPEFIGQVERGEVSELSLAELEAFATALDLDVTDLVRRRVPE